MGLAVVVALAGGCSSGDEATAAGRPEFVQPSVTSAPSASVAPGASASAKTSKGTPQKNKTWTPTSKVKIKPIPTATTVKAGATQKNVTEGAFCSPIGGLGYTKSGKKVECTLLQGDERSRWRAA